MPHVALLRGGTMNTVANSVGVRRGRPEGLLGRLVRAYAQRASEPLANVERHVMRVDARSSGGRESRGALRVSLRHGVVHGFLAEYYRDGEPTPARRRQDARPRHRQRARRRRDDPPDGRSPSAARSRSTTARVWEERDYLAVAAGTIAHIGLNFRPFYRYDERPGAFHMLGIHASPARLREGAAAHPSRAGRCAPGKTYDAAAEPHGRAQRRRARCVHDRRRPARDRAASSRCRSVRASASSACAPSSAKPMLRTRIFAITLNTYREAVRARLLLGVFALSLATSAYSLVVAALSLGNEARVVADLGSLSFSLYGVIVAIVLGSTSLYRELEYKTIFPFSPAPSGAGSTSSASTSARC